ncbi:MAG: ABC-2 family transporter protein [Muribaculaceae bacterium]|nr:ABC-2 family transporter protein [Roseburia sp.]MCM1430141.1 ABC-2 family transporter protein [Muribaculaceae bacterium]MCM1493072.1 ABC-2 family transporter protein [Muribaculaceae bacterium]
MGKRIKNAIRLYGHYVSINVRSMMQYKTSFFLTVLGQFFVSFNVFLGIYFLFQRFQSVKGYTYNEVLLCFSIVLMELSLAEMFARGFDAFSGMVREGSFDLVMVRPRNEILQVLGSKFELTRIGRMLQSIVMFAYAVCHCGVAWTLPKVVTILFMLLGGTAVFSGLFLVNAALCFFTLEGLEIMSVFTDGAREFGKYPLEVYGRSLLVFATFVVPYALIQYYPLLYILGRTESIVYALLPLCAIAFLLPCWLLWSFGVRHYQSSGS